MTQFTLNPQRLFFVLIAALTLSFSGCFTKKCGDGCLNGGVCTDGTCDCPNYYEGSRCENLERDKFLGEFTITYRGYIYENPFVDPYQFRLDTTVIKTIYTDAANNKIRIPDFLGYYGSAMTCTVVQDRIELGDGNYPIRLPNGQQTTLDIDLSTGTLQGNQVIVELTGAGLGLQYQISGEMILTKRP